MANPNSSYSIQYGTENFNYQRTNKNKKVHSPFQICKGKKWIIQNNFLFSRRIKVRKKQYTKQQKHTQNLFQIHWMSPDLHLNTRTLEIIPRTKETPLMGQPTEKPIRNDSNLPPTTTQVQVLRTSEWVTAARMATTIVMTPQNPHNRWMDGRTTIVQDRRTRPSDQTNSPTS